MDQPSVESALADLNIPAIRFFESIGSTNNEAKVWLNLGAPNLALVIANEQSAGRGRYQRHWITVRNAGLAFSLILRSPAITPASISRLNGLAAVAIHAALFNEYKLSAQIKWPNDILISGKKVSGILVETIWNGEQLAAAIIGIGINIAPGSIGSAELSGQGLLIPPGCLETELRFPVNRLKLLHAVMVEIFAWLPRLSSPGLIHAWQDNLAYLSQWVELSPASDAPSYQVPTYAQQRLEGCLIGLDDDGSLKLLTSDGRLVTAQVGELHLQPVSLGDRSRHRLE